MGEKFPLGHDLHIKTSKPFVAVLENGSKVIAVEDRLFNALGHELYGDYHVIDYNPSKEEMFKVTLANPKEATPVIPNRCIESTSRLRQEDN